MKTNFPSVWQEMLEKADFDSLTDIQQQAFEPIFTGKDLLAISPTGTVFRGRTDFLLSGS